MKNLSNRDTPRTRVCHTKKNTLNMHKWSSGPSNSLHLHLIYLPYSLFLHLAWSNRPVFYNYDRKDVRRFQRRFLCIPFLQNLLTSFLIPLFFSFLLYGSLHDSFFLSIFKKCPGTIVNFTDNTKCYNHVCSCPFDIACLIYSPSSSSVIISCC